MIRLANPGLTRRHANLNSCVHATRSPHGGAAESRNLERT